MRVEAIKVSNGFLIPRIGRFQNLEQDKILLEVEIVDQNGAEQGYAALDQLIGLCETGRADASLKHDEIIYSKRGIK